MLNKILSKKVSEPLFHVVKRGRNELPWYKAWLTRVFAIIIALVICSFVIVFLTNFNPFQVYASMFNGAFGSSRKIWKTLQDLSMLLCVSLAVTPAFKMKFWNIGAEGQALIGGLSSAACMIYLGNSVPSYLLIPLTFILSILSGVIWAVIPAFFKARFNTNETLFTLMMNYVAMQLVSFCIVFWENPKGSNSVGVINGNSHGGWLPQIFGQKYLLNIIIVTAIMIFMYIYLKYSKHGYEISVVGESENTAKYIGINVKKVIIRTMALSGALCGIAGTLLVSGTDHSIKSDTIGGLGFTAIMVSWLAKFNPIIMALTSFLIVFLERGAGSIATQFNLNESVADILTGIILFFIIGSEFFISYTIQFRHSKTKEEQK